MLFNSEINKKKLASTYLWVTICAGGLIYLVAGYRLNLKLVDLNLVVITILTIFISSRISIRIPHFDSQISVSDTFIFLTLLLYGYEVAILMAATEALLSSLRFCHKRSTIFFNWGCAAWSACVTSYSLYFVFGDVVSLGAGPLSARFITAMALMALVQYVSNSGMVAICGALQAGRPIWQTWKKHYLWTSITYFAGASAAAVIAKFVNQFGFYALIITLPIMAIVFFTYRTYLQNIEASAAQADQAERHVQELSHYIAEQDRIREQFSQIEKLSALGELASGVAHDFNNTLAGILGRAQLMLRTNDPEKISRGLNIIIKTAEDGAKTVKRIQDFARQRRDHDFEPVSIDQILFDVSEVTRPRWKNRAEACKFARKLKSWVMNPNYVKFWSTWSSTRSMRCRRVANSLWQPKMLTTQLLSPWATLARAWRLKLSPGSLIPFSPLRVRPVWAWAWRLVSESLGDMKGPSRSSQSLDLAPNLRLVCRRQRFREIRLYRNQKNACLKD
jgi:hypothetical protein